MNIVISGTFHELKNVKAKNGNEYKFCVLRDYETFTEIELFCGDMFSVDSGVKQGDKVQAIGRINGNRSVAVDHLKKV